MGQACSRQAKKTIKIPIKSRTKQIEVDLPHDEFPINQVQGFIGQFFQYKAESEKPLVIQKQKEWDSILEDKQVEFTGISLYNQLLEFGDNQYQDNLNDIVDFIELDRRNQSDSDSPINHPEYQVSKRESLSISKIRKSNQETLLEEIFINGKCHLRQQNEILMYIFSRQMPQRFNSLIRSGLPYTHRWTVWKIRFHDENQFDPYLYQKLLAQIGPDEIGINKDITRTFPKHPYFQQDEQGESLGQTQLFKVLKALSILFPKVGYCQGMNFLAGFLLITNGGNDEEAFWFFKNLLESSEFMITGLFEVGFPLTNILTELFKQQFEEKMPLLYRNFADQFIPENLYVFKWFTTLFIYSFPFSVVYRLWDYIISKNILSSVSISLAIVETYQQKLINFDLADISLFFSLIHDSEQILIDPKCVVYLDINKVIQLAETKYMINYSSDDQGNPYAIGLTNMTPHKKYVQRVQQNDEDQYLVENLN